MKLSAISQMLGPVCFGDIGMNIETRFWYARYASPFERIACFSVGAEGQGVTVTQQALTIAPPASPAMELPLRRRRGRWADAQTVASEGAPLDPMAFATSRTSARSRLIAPRQLVPEDTLYRMHRADDAWVDRQRAVDRVARVLHVALCDRT